MNFDNRSLKLNDEVTLVAQDETLGRTLREMFLRDLELADEVELRRFEQRSSMDRVREQLYRVVSSVL
jgi:phosphatidylserine/phosphatidylglycerophosphate/cardiolipin synthase-like enzyme